MGEGFWFLLEETMSHDPGNPIKNETGEYIGPQSHEEVRSEIHIKNEPVTADTKNAKPVKAVRTPRK
jgi:hypothetical protein